MVKKNNMPDGPRDMPSLSAALANLVSISASRGGFGTPAFRSGTSLRPNKIMFQGNQRKILGQRGEDAALEYLQNKGFKLVGRNVRLFCGEIDLLMEDKKSLVLVEVKTKTNSSFGLPQEMINYKKRRKLLQLAKVLTQKFPKNLIRIDVVAVDEVSGTIEHIVSAVEDV